MKNFNKYSKKYILPPDFSSHEKNAPFVRDIKPPLWCSVDLRDGNQALPVPMTAADKLRFFDLLVEIGFREIEISYPAASKEEWNFTKELSAGGHIQGDVLPQVITMMRPDIINRTFDAIEDMSRIIVNMYNPVSVSQLKILGQSEKDAIMLACENAKICAERAAKCRGEVIFEYTPESFSGAEPRFALEISERVLEILAPTPQKKAILNLPATLENSTPYIYAAQVDYINRNIKNRGCVTLSLHTHNDRGCAVADCETGLIFGGERVEGTLFGNGERTGNADIVTLALNMYSQGIDPGLDFSRLPYVASVFEEITGMHVPPRQPYAGSLVFTAFSGAHQDAIAKGIALYEKQGKKAWDIPYLPIDPHDVGRVYGESIIRINSQSGKGGVSFVLSRYFGLELPEELRREFTRFVKDASVEGRREFVPEDVFNMFKKEYVNILSKIKPVNVEFDFRDMPTADVTISENGQIKTGSGSGNGRLDAVTDALNKIRNKSYNIESYSQHAMTKGSKSRAVSYIKVSDKGKEAWGAGSDNDMMTASVNAFFSAINKLE